MRKRKPPPGLPPAPSLRRIQFEAALSPVGNCFSISGEGEARLILVVPESAAQPLVEAMAAGWLRNTTFVCTLATPGAENVTPPPDK